MSIDSILVYNQYVCKLWLCTGLQMIAISFLLCTVKFLLVLSNKIKFPVDLCDAGSAVAISGDSGGSSRNVSFHCLKRYILGIALLMILLVLYHMV